MNLRYSLLSFTLVASTASLVAQNDCLSALAITAGTYVVDTIDGPQVPLPVCATGGNSATRGEWYTYTPTEDHGVIISSDLPVNTGLDTRFHVYTGACGSLSCFNGDDDSGSGYLSYAAFNVTAGVTYTIAWDNRWSSSGFTFQLTEGSPISELVGFTTQTVAVSGTNRAVIDMNNDGLDDVVSVTATNININYQQPGGGFVTANYATTTAPNTPSWSLCAGDLDGNGQNDLMYGGGSGVTFMMANADGTAFTEMTFPQYVFCQRTNMVDINNDGLLDAFSCHDVAPNVYFLNNGDGTFTFYQGGLGDTAGGGNYGTLWTDFDNDGDIDMFIAKCRGGNPVVSTNQMHRNNGDGTFTEMAADINLADPMQTWSSAWADYDNDGDMDVMVGASSFTAGGHKLMRNDGTTFTDITAGSGFDTFAGTSIEHIAYDFNNDGWVDVMSGANTILLNNGDMTFTPNPVGVSVGPVGDLNNDGFLDIMSGGTAYLNTGNDNNWIRINTVGTVSNKNGIGARITVTTPAGSQIREIRSGEGFRYMSTLMAHFGLGDETEILQITVQWPSGIINTVTAPDINGTLTIVEEINTAVADPTATTLLIYPVPARDQLFVTGTQRTNAPVRVFDATGKLLLQGALVNDRLDVQALPTGLYVLEVSTANGPVQRSFTKE